MLIPVERLIDGCIQTLREEVLPEVEARAVRVRIFAVLDVLNNLRDRVEPKHAPAATEASSAAEALARLASALREAAKPDAAAATLRALASAPAEPPSARADALRSAIAEAITAQPQGLAAPEREALRAHLSAQALRDVMLLKPSLLSEISKG